jgi:hypothetical protein
MHPVPYISLGSVSGHPIEEKMVRRGMGMGYFFPHRPEKFRSFIIITRHSLREGKIAIMKKSGISIILFLTVSLSAPCFAADIQDRLINDIITDAGIKYETTFPLNTSREKYHKMLDNIVLMGKLWEMCGYFPYYTVYRQNGLIHIVDPKGLEGDMVELKSTGNQRVFCCMGKMNHKLVPLKLTGKVLFIIKETPAGNHLTLDLKIYAKGDNNVMNTGLKAISPLVLYLVKDRVSRNTRDFQTLASDLQSNPASFRGRLSKEMLFDFDRLVKR